MSIAGIILRSKSKEVTAEFYTKLGLKLKEHSHGGPLHFECMDFSDARVLEIYAQSEIHTKDALMIEVDSLVEASSVLAEFGLLGGKIKESEECRYLYSNDPDGRPLMIIEKHHGIHTN